MKGKSKRCRLNAPLNGPQSFLSHRFDFEAATVFAGPTNGASGTATTGGTCDVDTITVTQTTSTIGAFENLCGTLTGQHSNNFNINF